MIFEKRERGEIQEASMGFMIYDPDGCRGCVSFGGGGGGGCYGCIVLQGVFYGHRRYYYYIDIASCK